MIPEGCTLELDGRLEKDADGSYGRALHAILRAEQQRVERALAAGAPVDEYRALQCLSEGLLAAVSHLQALAAQKTRRTNQETEKPGASRTDNPPTGPDAVFKLLLELGFSAAFRGLTDCGTKIFAAGRVLRPNLAHPLLGEAVIRLQKLELTEAAGLLEEAVRREPENQLVQAFAATCGRLLGQLREARGSADRIVPQ